jgi:FkbM family methyltransferase
MARHSLRASFKKWLYGSCPGFAGAFPYYGIKIYFPKGSLLFDLACEQGVFEIDNVRLMQSLARPGTTIFDIGANIGLMSAPLLAEKPACRVVSFEPSPNVLPFLQRTIAESAHRDRWILVPKAVGAQPGRLAFHLSDAANSVYDGIRATNRAASVRQVEVEITTLDETWRELGRPKVSLIKCDVEGAEWDVLQGARECLTAERPPVLLEWNRDNLAAYQRPPESLVHFAAEADFALYAMPNLVEIHTAQQLAVQMCLTESFLLYPNESARASTS